MDQSNTNINNLEEKRLSPEMAGRLMTSEVPVVSAAATVSDIEKLLLKKAADFKSLNYIYLTDAAGRLDGVVSIKELFRSSKTSRLKNLSVPALVTVRPHTDRERVALIAIQHNIKAVPVVDKDDRFLGAVTSDTILNILHSKSVEDTLRQAGAGRLPNPATDIIHAGSWLHFRKRLPWLLLGLAGGIGAAFVVDFFEGALEQQLMLAAFIPAIVYMADAVGAQTQTIFIRSLALERSLQLPRYLWREFRVNLMLSALLALVMSVFAVLWVGEAKIGLVLGSSVLVTVLMASTVAVAMPLALQKFKFDPAIASGPFATVIRDLMSLLIYFAIASFLL